MDDSTDHSQMVEQMVSPSCSNQCVAPGARQKAAIPDAGTSQLPICSYRSKTKNIGVTCGVTELFRT